MILNKAQPIHTHGASCISMSSYRYIVIDISNGAVSYTFNSIVKQRITFEFLRIIIVHF